MQLHETRVVITGAAGGIGSALATGLAARGARLLMLGRDAEPLNALSERLTVAGGWAQAISVDLLDPSARDDAIARAEERLGGIDLLINCAGVQRFRAFVDLDPAMLERIIQLNLVVPMRLAQAVLPQMLARGSGRIVNIGSTFGSIGFACFAAYSASKYGLRGFSEALRRELDGSGVGVCYVAPRAVKTRLNSDAVYRMAEATKMRMDEPAWVAARIIRAIERDVKEVHLGFPERLFARLNGILPRLVDQGLRKQTRVMARFAGET